MAFLNLQNACTIALSGFFVLSDSISAGGL